MSRTGDDNFIVEDKQTATHEASFLTLDLHLLAKQLEKEDLSRRLLIEPDLFLAELNLEELQRCGEESDPAQAAFQSTETTKSSDGLNHDISIKDKLKDGDADLDMLKFFNSSKPLTKYKDTFSGQQEEIAVMSKGTSVSKEARAPDTVATNFDEDLDDLLKETSASLSGRISSVLPARPQPWNKGPDFSESALRMSNLDDSLDHLLVDASSVSKNSQLISSVQAGVTQFTKNDQDLPKPASVIANLDNDLDDLLNGTSKLTNKMDTTQSPGVISSEHSRVCSSSFVPVSKTKLLDDFDSFFETL